MFLNFYFTLLWLNIGFKGNNVFNVRLDMFHHDQGNIRLIRSGSHLIICFNQFSENDLVQFFKLFKKKKITDFHKQNDSK